MRKVIIGFHVHLLKQMGLQQCGESNSEGRTVTGEEGNSLKSLKRVKCLKNGD